ncbi:hypothetical protein [Nonomuraea dietziae]|uniref:hypothetical protein n=1 Tax=Nonomuraea dietziae TaxID=65515 RepID=UPI0031DAE365
MTIKHRPHQHQARSPGTRGRPAQDLHSGMEAVTGDIRELVYGRRPPAHRRPRPGAGRTAARARRR